MGPHPYPRSLGETNGNRRDVGAADAAVVQATELTPDEIALAQAGDGAAEDLSVWLDTVARIVSRILRSTSEDGAR